jgi:pSer/pThr/pTyr-binding forkhead associated (FHA) protein
LRLQLAGWLAPQVRDWRGPYVFLRSSVRPAAESSPIPREWGRQQPKTRTRRSGRGLTVLELAVSRRHASVYWRVGGWYVIDRRSTNGTFMNGSGIKANTDAAVEASR